MKLDIELCREILKKIQTEEGVDGLHYFPSIDSRTNEEVFYHIKMLQDAGYLSYKRFIEENPYDYFSVELTYEGHKFIESASNDTVWSKTKEVAKKTSLELTLETAKQFIPIAIKSLIGP